MCDGDCCDRLSVGYGRVGERGWLLAEEGEGWADSLKVDGVAKVLNREAGFQLGQ